VYQDVNNPDHGYFSPERGVIPDKTQDFIIIVNPCLVTGFSSASTMPDLTYHLGEPDKTVGTYSY